MPRAKTAKQNSSMQVGKSSKKTTPAKRLSSAMGKLKVAGGGNYLIPGTLARVGRDLGSRAGGWMGEGAGALLSSISGVGDYQMNNIIHTDRALTAPQPRYYEFTNTELVQVMSSPGTGFTSYSFANNPGLSNFPWLSAIAGRFNKYRFKQLVYHFESTSSEYASGAALGTVCLATNYDAADRTFRSMVEMEASENAVSGKPSVDKLHGCECAPADDAVKWRYVRSSAPPSGTDIRNYDHSDTVIAMEGLSAAAGTVIGRLKVFYTVQFTAPIALGIPASFLPAAPTARGWYNSSSGSAGVGPFFGTTAVGVPPTWGSGAYQTLPMTYGTNVSSVDVVSYPVADVSGGTITFNASGIYRVCAIWFLSTAPSGSTFNITQNGITFRIPATGAVGFDVHNSTDKSLWYFDAIVEVLSASVQSPKSFTISGASWGSSFVVGNAEAQITLLGQT